MTIRWDRAVAADAGEMVTLEGALFPEDAWSHQTFTEELRHPDSYYLVGRDKSSGQLIGYGGLRASVHLGGQGDIQTIAIASSYQGQGLGRSLLDQLLAEAWRRDVSEVFLEARADNAVAIPLYSRVGFHEIARRGGYYQSGQVDAVVMRATREHEEQTP
jgi:ribosomal-protein-alanine acetyltransferase